jgi:hypothetical protein
MLQAHRPDRPFQRITHRRTIRRRLALLPVVVVHGSGDVACASYLVLCREDAGGGEQHCGCGWGAQREVEGAVWTDDYARGDGGAGLVVGCSCVELLGVVVSIRSYWQ